MLSKKKILAVGADIKNRLLLANGKNIYFGPDIGDLAEAENYERFKKEICKAIKSSPDIIACDLHPGYFSTRLANSLGKPLPVQHHHAHIASVSFEHGLKKPLIGVSFDGTGLGTDGNIWGGEFLLVDKGTFKRLAHLKNIAMPGGEKVIRQPWRMVLSILGKKGLPFVRSVREEDKRMVLSVISRRINSPLTSSTGRLFDAAAALLGICEYARYEAEGPMKLEVMCADGIEESYGFEISKKENPYVIDTKPAFLGMAKDLKRGKKKEVIAAKFHNTVADIIVKTVKKLSRDLNIKDVALSGGVFQNRLLRKETIRKLRSSRFNVFINEKTPVNDFNISLGQYHVSCGTGRS